MFKLIFVIAAAAFLGFANGDVIRAGRCPADIQVVSDFQVDKYLGSWYEQARYPFLLEEQGKCNKATYSLDTDGVLVNNTMIDKNNGEFVDAIGQAILASSGKLKVRFFEFEVPANYWVLDTDYSSYSCVYSCEELPFFHITYAWILTREQNAAAEVIQKCNDVFTNNKISLDPFVTTIQTDC